MAFELNLDPLRDGSCIKIDGYPDLEIGAFPSGLSVLI